MSTPTSELISAAIAIPSGVTATNFFSSACDRNNDYFTTADQRLQSFASHIDATQGGRLVVVGEAAGWRGARQSGIAFTDAPTVGFPGTREASATTVRGVLARHNLLTETLLWNALLLHPHRLGYPRSNRTPTWAELILGGAALDLATRSRTIICVGRNSARAVAGLLSVPVDDVITSGVNSRAVFVRHPSHGGANIFRAQFDEMVERLGLV